MDKASQRQELYHEVFGSVLDREAMTPYLLKGCPDYRHSLTQAAVMLGNRGFDLLGGGELAPGEIERAQAYVRQARGYFTLSLFPFVKAQLLDLMGLRSALAQCYQKCFDEIERIELVLSDAGFATMVDEDPRHLFLMASFGKYPELFSGYRGGNLAVPISWQRMACSILKMCHLVKAIEEDSQDISDYAQLGGFFQSRGIGLEGLFEFDWHDPKALPTEEPSRRAYVKLAVFFRKMRESMRLDRARSCYVFDSGDGVRVDIVDVMARLKSPESMFAKLGKNVEGEAYDIRDVLAITFLLDGRDDALSLFHALQKRGVIIQEHTASASITQTLFDSPADMEEAVRRLMLNLYTSEGIGEVPSRAEVRVQAKNFFDALSVNAGQNPHSSSGHHKFQCKISFPVPIHYDRSDHTILLPGADARARLGLAPIITRQGTLPVEIRISDRATWAESETRGEAHHDAYKLRQLIPLCNRLFSPAFFFPREIEAGLRADQARLFS
jgi:uncharacterized protein (TIGR04552 family)